MMETTAAPAIIEHQQSQLSFTPYETKWLPCSARFVCAGITPKAKGILQVSELEAGTLKSVGEVETSAGIKCATNDLATGDYAGMLRIFDVERLEPKYEVEAHAAIVNSVDGIGGIIGGGAPEIATGSRDGCVKVWDPRVKEAVVTLEPVEARDCWTVAFGNSVGEDRVVAAGYDNGDVKLFDLRTTSMRWETNVSNGVTCVEFDRADVGMNKLVVTTLESKFRVFDVRTQHAERGFPHVAVKAHKATVWVARHLPQNRDVWMTGGGNGGFNLYTYHYPKKRVVTHTDSTPMGVIGTVELVNSRVISTQPVVTCDWSPDKLGLAVLACLDQTVRVFICTKLDKL